MEFMLVRDSSGNWWDINDTLAVLIGFPASNEDEVVAYILKTFPGAVFKAVWH